MYRERGRNERQYQDQERDERQEFAAGAEDFVRG